MKSNKIFIISLAFVLVLIGRISVYVMHRIGAKGYIW